MRIGGIPPENRQWSDQNDPHFLESLDIQLYLLIVLEEVKLLQTIGLGLN